MRRALFTCENVLVIVALLLPLHGLQINGQQAVLQQGRIAFIQAGNIWTSNPDGGQIKQLTIRGGYSQPEWSPDGRKIAFIHQIWMALGQTFATEIGFLDLSNNQERIVVQAERRAPFINPYYFYYIYYNLRWSRDNTSLYYIATDMTVGGDHVHKIDTVSLWKDYNFSPFFTRSFDVSRVNDWIVYTDFSNAPPIIGYSLNLANPYGGQKTVLIPLTNLVYISLPRWSPDGSHIAFFGQGGAYGDNSIVVINSNNTDRKIYPTQQVYGQISWAPDGNGIAYDTASSINLLDLTSGSSTTFFPGNDPCWVNLSTISGRITDNDGYPLGGVIISDGQGYTSDPSNFIGTYLLANLTPGIHILTPHKTGYTFFPTTLTVSVPPNASNQDFVSSIGFSQIEVNQTLGQDLGKGNVRLVAGKDAVIRVFLQDYIRPNPLRQQVVIKRDNILVATLHPQVDLLSLILGTNLLTFSCPDRNACGSWQAGYYTFEITVNGSTTLQIAVFQPRKPIRVLAVPVKVKDGNTVKTPADTWKTAGKFLNQVYPLANNGVIWDEHSELDQSSLTLTFDGNCDSNKKTDRCRLSEALRALQPDPCGGANQPACYDEIIGFIPEMRICDPQKPTICLGGWTYPGSRTNVVMTKQDVEATIAHEIGHNYDLGDEYNNMCGAFQCSINPPPKDYCGRNWNSGACDNSFKCINSNSIAWTSASGNATGSRVVANMIYPYEVGGRGALEDKLSFMGSGGSQTDYWVTSDIYNHLFDSLQIIPTSSPIPLATGRVIYANGYIAQNGSVFLNPWYHFETSLPASVLGGYTIEALDGSNQILASQNFDVPFLALNDPPVVIDPAPFEVQVAYPANTTSFRIRQGSMILKVVQISANAPSVQVTYPNGGEVWNANGNYTISWSGNDLDGDSLTYTVLYSPDGQDWMVLRSELQQTQLVIPAAELAGGTGARVRVVATDSVNTVQDDSNAAYTVGRKPPEAFILYPPDGTILPAGSPVPLRGYGYSLEDKALDDAKLQWSSDKDGLLGTTGLLMVNLTPGRHRITLTVTDNIGSTTSTSIDISVLFSTYIPFVKK